LSIDEIQMSFGRQPIASRSFYGKGGRMQRRKAFLISTALGILVFGSAFAANSAQILYTYDVLGRVTTALNPAARVCIAYSYDANGNRTSQVITISSAPETPTWGTGVAGCFLWTQQ
jgi:YD repeat-containing protein